MNAEYRGPADAWWERMSARQVPRLLRRGSKPWPFFRWALIWASTIGLGYALPQVVGYAAQWFFGEPQGEFWQARVFLARMVLAWSVLTFVYWLSPKVIRFEGVHCNGWLPDTLRSWFHVDTLPVWAAGLSLLTLLTEL